MKAVILAAGQGSRLRPLTDDRPKCMVSYQGRPLIEKAMAYLDARRFDVAQVTTVVAPFDDTPQVLAEAPMKAVLVRDPIYGGGL